MKAQVSHSQHREETTTTLPPLQSQRNPSPPAPCPVVYTPPAMLNLGADRRPPVAAASASDDPLSSFLSRSWRKFRNSAGADLRFIRSQANSIISPGGFENFFNVSPSAPPSSSSSTSLADLEFVKRIKPKLTELGRAYSSPDFSKKVLERWGSSSRIRLDLSAIGSALVAEEGRGTWDLDWDRARTKGRRITWKAVEGVEQEEGKEWDPFRMIKTSIKELEKKGQTTEIFGGLKNSEFVEKVKLSLKSFRGEPLEFLDAKEVPPLDPSELLAYLVKQSGPLFEQLGGKRDVCDRIADALYKRRKDQSMSRSLSLGDLGHEETSDELDYRVASVLQSTGHHYDSTFWDHLGPEPTTEKKRHVAIVTTASLPWLTGTAVNPLFRAAYLAKSAQQNVTLLVPWLCKSDQELVYPNSLTFNSPEEQETYIRNWLEERIGFKADFKISFYPGKFQKERRSIIPAGDTTQFISSREADIAILEEPEHLNWYHHGKRWTDKFNHVVGVVHTNYLEYIKREKNGALQAFFVKHINNWVIRAYCDKVLRLSAATQDLPKSEICNVHGVNPNFLKVGEKIASEREHGQESFSKGAYFLGKMVWAKGYKELIDLLAKHKNDLDGFNLDVYGNGEDAQEVQSTAKKLDLKINFMKGRDHADDSLHGYKVFINPSVSDVLCTATAEALAMGKFVICADHPSNDFFRAFPNCLTYKTSEDFVARVKEAMARDPQPLTAEQRHDLSWEAATERFLEYSELDKVLNSNIDGRDYLGGSVMKPMKKSVSLPNLANAVDGGLAFAHHCLTGSEILRLSTGAVPGTRDYNMQHCQDLHLTPPQIQNPVYGW